MADAMNVVDWRADLTTETIEMLSQAFAGNPIHVAAFGADRVVERNRRFFAAGLSMFRGRRRMVVDGDHVVGFMHWVESPGCQYSAGKRLSLVPTMLRGFGLKATLRVGPWLSAWAKNDDAGPHVHLGPIGVDPRFHGKGIGGRMMRDFCAALDAKSAAGFLETDKAENVGFYEKSGFRVIREVQVIGTATYFMRRAAADSGKPG
jgi:ribosomal protein S18 acetylase RimI-like enzyme